MTHRRRCVEQLAIVCLAAVLVLAVDQIVGGEAPSTATEDRSTEVRPPKPETNEEPQPDPPKRNPSACQGWDDEKRAVRNELTMLVRDARATQKTIDELEEEVRDYPEDRSKIAPDLRIARRELQDSKREMVRSRHEIEVVNDDARSEGCGR